MVQVKTKKAPGLRKEATRYLFVTQDKGILFILDP